jgi:hypothetical protein
VGADSNSSRLKCRPGVAPLSLTVKAETSDNAPSLPQNGPFARYMEKFILQSAAPLPLNAYLAYEAFRFPFGNSKMFA